jgi:Periplasmic binding protein
MSWFSDPGVDVSRNVRNLGALLAAGGLLVTAAVATGGQAWAQEAAKGPSYTVVYETQLTGGGGTGVTSPEGVDAFKAVFAGSPVTVNVCDNQGTTTGNLDCEHSAVADHAAAFVETDASEDQSLVDQANIPVVGVANDTSRQSFDVSAQQGLFVGMAVAMQKKGCKRIGQVIDEGGQSYGNQVAKAIKWQSVTDAYIPISAPDLSPDIAKLVQAHVQCVDMAMLPTQIPQAMTAMKQANLKVPVVMPGVILTPQVISSLGSLGNGLIEIVSTPAPNSPAVAAVTKKMHTANKGIKVDTSSLDSWAIARIIQDGAGNVHGSVTNTTMLAALNKLRNASTDGLFPPLSMKPQSNPAALRDFDTYVQSVVLENGKQTQPSGYFNVAPQIKAALTNG